MLVLVCVCVYDCKTGCDPGLSGSLVYIAGGVFYLCVCHICV